MFHHVDSENRIPRILGITSCTKHKAKHGDPCFTIIPGSSSRADVLFGVCGRRVRNAGYNGKISPGSVRVVSSGRRSDARKS